MENFVSIASARGGGGLAKMSADKMVRKRRQNEKKQALKVNKLGILLKNLMYLKIDFVSKEAFSREGEGGEVSDDLRLPIYNCE